MFCFKDVLMMATAPTQHQCARMAMNVAAMAMMTVWMKIFVIQTSTNVRRSLMSAILRQRLRTVMQMLLVNVTLINLFTHSASTVTQKDLITSANQV